MEDYEVYYKKQRADSNCGFAEEFEVKHNNNFISFNFLISYSKQVTIAVIIFYTCLRILRI